MIKLGHAFLEISNEKGLNRGLNEARALSVWQEVVGLNIKNNTKPQKIKNGILFVSTKSPAWAQELKNLEENIKKNINAHLKKHVVKEIRFLIDGFSPSGEEIFEEEPETDFCDYKIELSGDEKKFVKKLSTYVEDEELRSCLEIILMKDKKTKKLRRNKNTGRGDS